MRTVDDLRQVMHELENDAPEPADVLPATGADSTRTRYGWLAATTAAFVTAVTIAALLIVGHHRSGNSAGLHSGPVPTGLIDVDWLATAVTPAAGLTPPFQAGFVIRQDGTITGGLDRCDGLEGIVRFAAHTAYFDTQDRNHSCPDNPRPESRQLAVLTLGILNGPVQWTLDGNRLTITKTGVGTITYTRGPADSPSPTA